MAVGKPSDFVLEVVPEMKGSVFGALRSCI